MQDKNRLFEISYGLKKAFGQECELIAEKLAVLIRKHVPSYLWGEWDFANRLANLPVLDSVIELLIKQSVLSPPENGIGAEGCWMSVMK